jgi:hypothetical protein
MRLIKRFNECHRELDLGSKMRQIIKLGLIVSFINNAFALEPVQGVYLGLLGGASYTNPRPSFNIDYKGTVLLGPNLSVPKIKLSPVGGDVGFSLGYRISPVRLEGQLFFNINNYSELPLSTCTLVSPTVWSPQPFMACAEPVLNENSVAFNGNIMSFLGFFNIFYDFLSCDSTTSFFPYIGAGIGGGIIRNTVNFKTNNIVAATFYPYPFPTHTFTSSSSGVAAQGILGFGYYLDDFATLGLDIRYVGTFRPKRNNTLTTLSNTSSTMGIASINISATFALEKVTT